MRQTKELTKGERKRVRLIPYVVGKELTGVYEVTSRDGKKKVIRKTWEGAKRAARR